MKTKQTDRVGRPKQAKIKDFSSSISEVSFVSILFRSGFAFCSSLHAIFAYNLTENVNVPEGNTLYYLTLTL